MTDQTPMSETDLEAIRKHVRAYVADPEDAPILVEAATDRRRLLDEVDRLNAELDNINEVIRETGGFVGLRGIPAVRKLGERNQEAKAEVERLRGWLTARVAERDALAAEVRRLRAGLADAPSRRDLLVAEEAMRAAQLGQHKAEAARSELSDAMTVAYESMNTLSERGGEAVRERDALRAELAELRADHLGHIDRVTRAAVDRADALAAKVDAVRECHEKTIYWPSGNREPGPEDETCLDCNEPWPCATTRALDPEPAHGPAQRVASGPDSPGGSTGRGTDDRGPHARSEPVQWGQGKDCPHRPEWHCSSHGECRGCECGCDTVNPRLEPAQPDRWRVGRHVGRTVYIQTGSEPSREDPLIGVMDTPELARAAVEAHNALAEDESEPDQPPDVSLVPVELIGFNPHIRGGQPCIVGTRIPVVEVAGHLDDGATWDEVREMLPSLPPLPDTTTEETTDA